MTAPANVPAEAPGVDPRHALRERLLRFGDAVRRARREIDANRQAIAAFEQLDEFGVASRIVTNMAELIERSLDGMVSSIEDASVQLASDALADARRALPPLPTGDAGEAKS